MTNIGKNVIQSEIILSIPVPEKIFQKKFAGTKKMLTFAIPFEKRGTEEIIEKTGKYK